MKRIAFISDLIFTFCVGFVFTLVVFRYSGVEFFTSLFLAALCGGLIAAAVGAVLQSKRKNLYLKKSEEEEKRKLLLHLALLSDEKKTEYLQTALFCGEDEARRFGKLRLFDKTHFYFLRFSLNPLSADEIPVLARLKTGKKKVLLCAQIEESAAELCSRLDIEVKDGEWTYRRLKELNALPDRYLGEPAPSQPVKRKLKGWFSKKNAKRFLVSGALILLLSRLTPYYAYYLFFGISLLGASVFVRIFGYA